MLEPLAACEPPTHGTPKVNGSIFRIARDTRFSADKTPYKTHLAFSFWYGARKKQAASFYLGIEEDSVHGGAGVFGFPKDALEAYRRAVAGPEGAQLAAAITSLEEAGWGLRGETSKRVPKPHDPDHPRADLLKHKGLYVTRALDLGSALHTAALVDHTVACFREAQPVAEWLHDVCFRG